MLKASLPLGRRFISADPPPGRILLCGLTGSHFYGFPSPDSDLDLKGAHLAPTEELLGLQPPGDTFERVSVFEGMECDYTSHELGKVLRLLLRGNGNMLERILSPIQLYQTEELEALQALARGAISRAFSGHYLGFFGKKCAEHQRAETPSVKTLLYSFRVILTGLHLMTTGELVGDLPELASRYGLRELEPLVALKRNGQEKMSLGEEDDRGYRALWAVLEDRFHHALAESPLPEQPVNREACDETLRALRMKHLRAGKA